MPPRLFLSKSPQTVENTRRPWRKEEQERTRVGKWLCRNELGNVFGSQGWNSRDCTGGDAFEERAFVKGALRKGVSEAGRTLEGQLRIVDGTS